MVSIRWRFLGYDMVEHMIVQTTQPDMLYLMKIEHDKNNITNEQKIHTMYCIKVFQKFISGIRRAHMANKK